MTEGIPTEFDAQKMRDLENACSDPNCVTILHEHGRVLMTLAKKVHVLEGQDTSLQNLIKESNEVQSSLLLAITGNPMIGHKGLIATVKELNEGQIVARNTMNKNMAIWAGICVVISTLSVIVGFFSQTVIPHLRWATP